LSPLSAVLGAAAAVVPKLSLVACFVTLISGLFLSESKARYPKTALFALIVAICGSTVGLMRFIIVEAIPGIAQGGQSALDRSSVSELRQIVAAEDAIRRGAHFDPDHDGIGSAAGLRELSGLAPLRGYGYLDPPALDYREAAFVPTSSGTAVQVGAYLYMVCLPTSDGIFSAFSDVAVDEEKAERRFIAYAWPLASGMGSSKAFCIDEHERIWTYGNRQNGVVRYAGPSFPPACNAILTDGTEWRTWMNKKPREVLPGDR
jgi:hypothetical protein